MECAKDTVDAYLAGLTRRGFAPATVASRAGHLAHLCKWLVLRGLTSFDSLDLGHLDEYQAWIYSARRADGAPYAWPTRSQRISALRMLLAWALRTKRILSNPASALELPRLPRRLPRAVLNEREAERVLALPLTTKPTGLKDRAVLEVLYSTGIRRSELTQLDLPDVDAERGLLFVREGKGGKDRVVPLGARALSWVSRYVRTVRDRFPAEAGGGALFLNARGRRITPKRLTDRLRSYLVASGIPKPGSCHIWRHTMATLMHDGGADIRDLQEILGHADLSTTEIYTHVSIRRLQRVHAATHPAERGARRSKPRTPMEASCVTSEE